MSSTPAERLQELIRLLDSKSVSAFASAIGVSNTVLANILGGRMSKPSFETLEKIKATYPRVNLEWLVSGEGQPLRPPVSYASATDIQLVNEPPALGMGKQQTAAQLQAALTECRKELEYWKEKAEAYRQLAEDRQTIIELLRKQY